MAKLSPMMTYYLSLKEEYKQEILLFRLGDFYEMFFDDAVKASKLLDLTLTGRDCGLDERAPMCGVPYHAVDNYISKLVAAGEKVAICEQLSDPKLSKGLVDRGVVRVITPGTLIDSFTLDDKKSNYLAVVSSLHGTSVIAWADISTGEFSAIELGNTVDRQIEDMLSAINPSEILVADTNLTEIESLPIFKYGKIPKPFSLQERYFRYNNAYDRLIKQLNVPSMQPFECQDKKDIICACGALLEYLFETQKRAIDYIKDFRLISKKNFMFLDANTRRNLEINANARDGKQYGTLSWVLNKTRSSIGNRTFAKWLDRPLINAIQINERLSAVAELVDNNIMRDNAQDALNKMNDLERLVNRLAYHNEKPIDYKGISDSLQVLPLIKSALNDTKSKYLIKQYNDIAIEQELAAVLSSAIADKVPATFKDGGLIADGFNKQLDELRKAKTSSTDWINQLEIEERERTGIKLLKIRYNKVFGFYIEVPNSVKDKVPYRYIRKQTLVNAERFITDELKQIEDTVLNSEAKSLELEEKIIEEIRQTILTEAQQILLTCRALGNIDAIASFAEVSRSNDYVKPIIDETVKALNIEFGRHPVVEKFVGRNNFTSNNTYLDSSDSRTMVITGPNMAGKSTYMRQVAIITLMAHMGCFVPCKSAEIPLTDRIFTRVGASDDLSFGQSTFMVEMLEVATILKNCTDKSLLILDEIGRGTSTCDGLSIAWAVIEYITKHYHTKTLFSTHYHELTSLEGMVEGLKNYKVLVSEIGDNLVFSHKITRGGANKSFGIEVAKLAGLPTEVTQRALVLASKIEKLSKIEDSQSLILDSDCFDKTKAKQLSFLDQSRSEELLDILSNLDTNAMTPMQAMLELDNLIQRAKRIKR